MLDPKTIRNVAIIAHDGAGKTALTEALLRHYSPARASKDGSTSHLDVDPEESKRNFTVATHITYAEHEGTLLNLLDAPGFSDFLTDADRSMAVCEGGLLLVSAVSGVKHQTEAHWDMAAERSGARLRGEARHRRGRRGGGDGPLSAASDGAPGDQGEGRKERRAGPQRPAGRAAHHAGVPQHRGPLRRSSQRLPRLLRRGEARHGDRERPHREQRDRAARLPHRR